MLTSVMVVGIAMLLAWRHRLLASWPVIAGIALPWVGFSIWLRVRAETWGKERRWLDWWSVPHLAGGVLLGLFGLGGVLVAVIALLWECAEIASRVHEYPTNRFADVVLAISGWSLANLVVGGPFAPW